MADTDRYLQQAQKQSHYYVTCSDCESPSDDFFTPEQAAEHVKREGWKFTGARIVCNRCAAYYPKASLTDK